jgi:SAM-dependent methyltransferase
MRFAKWRFRAHRKSFAGKIGLEIGGPTLLFEETNFLPVYAWAERVDGVNFARQTVWEGTIKEGPNYKYAANRCGHQYIREATDLGGIDDASYDFVLSSHSLEHSANALKAVSAWTRVLKPGGVLVVAVPNPPETFDHLRQVTSFSHLLEDFEKNVGEDDMTHLDEVLRLHDRSRDPPSGTAEEFRERSLKNVENRCLHHHVFDAALMRRVFAHVGVVPFYEHVHGGSVITVGTKK